MKRILPFLLAVPFAAYAFACSSDSDSDNPNNTGGNTENDGGGNTNPGDGNTPVDPAEATINPADGVQVAEFSNPEAAVHGMTWIPAEKAWYVAQPTSTVAFDGTPATATTSGKVVRIEADGRVTAGVLGGTATTGDIFSVAFNATANKVWAIGTSQIVNLEPTGAALQTGTTFATKFSGLASDDAGTDVPFTGINDLVVKKDGSAAYVTSPFYPTDIVQTDFNRVFYVKSDGTAASVAHYENNERPNGIALSPDEKTLYVSLTSPTVANPGRNLPVYGEFPAIWKYTVNADGSLSGGAKFAQVGTTKSTDEATKPDGLAVDKVGNVYVATIQGVVVYKPSGDVWGTITTPEQAASLAFGGEDLKTLYIGSSNDPGVGAANNTGKIYKAQLKVTGIAK